MESGRGYRPQGPPDTSALELAHGAGGAQRHVGAIHVANASEPSASGTRLRLVFRRVDTPHATIQLDAYRAAAPCPPVEIVEQRLQIVWRISWHENDAVSVGDSCDSAPHQQPSLDPRATRA